MTTKTRRPKDAATLILIRDGREVLMGRRNSRHAFLPGHHVFPGGQIERADCYITPATDLRPEVAQVLDRRSARGRARALALAAIRETYEETGLCLGQPHAIAPRSRSAAWSGFFREGLSPTLHVLDFIARAITPPRRPRRFDARFLVADAKHLHGTLGGTGELLDLQWVRIDQARDLKLPRITALVIELLGQKSSSTAANAPVPMITYRRGQYMTEYL